ncbi:MAG: hypothetical protein LBL45_08505 [Treponema sp.]|jgi:choline kinase|nr:hypothetical protein [Treponema sp.]
MKVLIITAAGTARRFNRDIEHETAKCIFYHDKPQNALLYQLCAKAEACDAIIIVGGYQYSQVTLFVERYIKPNFARTIEMRSILNMNHTALRTVLF